MRGHWRQSARSSGGRRDNNARPTGHDRRDLTHPIERSKRLNAKKLCQFAIAILASSACSRESAEHHSRKKLDTSAPVGVEIDSAKLAMYAPLPDVADSKANPVTDEKAFLGRMLFYDQRLSTAQDLSCNSCHKLDDYGADGRDFSLGHKGKKLSRNSPTIYGAALGFTQFWDGRAETVEDAVKGILLDPDVMAESNERRITDTLGSMPEYAAAFKLAFPDAESPVTLENTTKALGAFIRRLLTPSKWDRFLKGEKAALDDSEKKGFLKFVEVGCPTCHVGPLVGGTMYQVLGKEKAWPNQKDKGRSSVTKSPSDDMTFKVPQLRNIERTAPYFHDASSSSLDSAVKTMAEYQLKKEISAEDAGSIVTWLKTLTGTIPSEFIRKPTLPTSTAKTPKPDTK